MKPTVLSLDCPVLSAVFIDLPLMQLWEHLRRSPSPLAANELAKAAGIPPAAAQRELDRLVEAGLAVRVKAHAGRRQISYRAISANVVVRWDRTRPEQFETVQTLRRRLRELANDVFERNRDVGFTGTLKRPMLEDLHELSITREEARAAHAALRAAAAALEQIATQAKARRAGPPSADAQSVDARTVDDAEGELPYQITIDMRPLAEPPPVIPEIGIWEAGGIAHELEYREKSPSALLSPRELQIAQRLAKGESRPSVAKALGLTVNTLGTISKRIYRKLGVRNRAMFTARMRGS
ncbi:MAG: LuxR C-terminal-related transcriptional regulator [bacterium]|jgi:DNA-binding NarL/FixJ family response regulator/DNA-binding Lrp family transcriptional regulator